jgi:hypothetical protein
MKFPASTGQAARFIGTTEPRLNGLLRRAAISPAPVVSAGRRLWEVHHIERAAEALGLATDELRARIAELEPHLGENVERSGRRP